MLEVTLDLDWSDDRYPFVRKSQVYVANKIVLTLADDLKIEGNPTNLREFASQIIAACDQHYPLEVAVVS
jgi:5'(3')-deoxyribonucleotidase